MSLTKSTCRSAFGSHAIRSRYEVNPSGELEVSDRRRGQCARSTRLRFLFHIAGFEGEEVPCVPVRIEPAFRVAIICSPKDTRVIRQKASHLAVFMRLTVLSGVRKPFSMRCDNHFGNTVAWQNMHDRAVIFGLPEIYKAIEQPIRAEVFVLAFMCQPPSEPMSRRVFT